MYWRGLAKTIIPRQDVMKSHNACPKNTQTHVRKSAHPRNIQVIYYILIQLYQVFIACSGKVMATGCKTWHGMCYRSPRELNAKETYRQLWARLWNFNNGGDTKYVGMFWGVCLYVIWFGRIKDWVLILGSKMLMEGGDFYGNGIRNRNRRHISHEPCGHRGFFLEHNHPRQEAPEDIR